MSTGAINPPQQRAAYDNAAKQDQKVKNSEGVDPPKDEQKPDPVTTNQADTVNISEEARKLLQEENK